MRRVPPLLAFGRLIDACTAPPEDMFKAVMFIGTGPATPSPLRTSRAGGSRMTTGAPPLGQPQTAVGGARMSAENALQAPEPVIASGSGASTSGVGGATVSFRRASSRQRLKEERT